MKSNPIGTLFVHFAFAKVEIDDGQYNCGRINKHKMPVASCEFAEAEKVKEKFLEINHRFDTTDEFIWEAKERL